jgi:hypothetical protein
MALTQRGLDELADWVADAPELAEERRVAWTRFFGEDDPRPVEYWGGAQDPTSRQRRFLGYFLLTHRLPDGRTPGTVGATTLLRGTEREDALRALSGARYVMAVVRSVLPGEAVFLALERERFEVRHRPWSWQLTPHSTVYAHLVPSRRGIWLLGPGWVQLPIELGPGIRSHLRDLQPDPISVERLLQRRSEGREEELPPVIRDDSLEAAVARMRSEAEAAGKEGLLLSAQEWQALVLRHLSSTDVTAFAREIVERVGEAEDGAELNRWMALAHNIWNTTPQPDRGGKTANQLSQELRGEP